MVSQKAAKTMMAVQERKPVTVTTDNVVTRKNVETQRTASVLGSAIRKTPNASHGVRGTKGATVPENVTRKQVSA